MTDIFIKSFNRPFYLDRCINSIITNLTGSYSIKVLDDGTPIKYIEKLQEKYPNVEILSSKNSPEKRIAIAENLATKKQIDGFKIPTDFWYNNVKNASDYIVVTEDDVWFTEPLNINELHQKAQSNDINLVKLGWLGNDDETKDLTIKPISKNLLSAIPKDLLLMNRSLMKAFFNNDYKLFTILYKLKIVDNLTPQKYWSLNSILMGFYKKQYWLEIWKDMDGKVDEKKQLVNASSFYKKNIRNKSFVARLENEAMKTTFQSSATNSYHAYGFDFDVNLFNHLINEAWHAGEFDPMQNFPNDFSMSYFETFISEKINITEFRKWVDQFKEQYRSLGCKVD